MSIWEGAKDYVKDRTTNPLFGSYLVSWIAVNWRVVVLLLSTESVTSKYAIFDDVLWSQITRWGFAGFWIPALIAGIYTFIWPYGDAWLTGWLDRRANDKKTERIKAARQAPLWPSEADQLRLEAEKLQSIIEQKDVELRQLMQQLSGRIDEIGRLNANLQDMTHRHRMEEQKVLDSQRLLATRGLVDTEVPTVMRVLDNQTGGVPLTAIRSVTGYSVEKIKEIIGRFPDYFVFTVPTQSVFSEGPVEEHTKLSVEGQAFANALFRG